MEVAVGMETDDVADIAWGGGFGVALGIVHDEVASVFVCQSIDGEGMEDGSVGDGTNFDLSSGT
mgnify:CR=1 FL=1